MRIALWIAILLILLGLAPFLSVLLSSAIANWGGCTLNEGSVNPCVIAGHDYGETLASMFVMGWLVFLTWPLSAAGGTLLIILFIIAVIRRLRRL